MTYLFFLCLSSCQSYLGPCWHQPIPVSILGLPFAMNINPPILETRTVPLVIIPLSHPFFSFFISGALMHTCMLSCSPCHGYGLRECDRRHFSVGVSYLERNRVSRYHPNIQAECKLNKSTRAAAVRTAVERRGNPVQHALKLVIYLQLKHCTLASGRPSIS